MKESTPWVIISFGFHFTAGQSKAVAGLADYLARSGVPVHLVGLSFARLLLDRPEITIHKVPQVKGADVVGNLIVSRVGRAIAKRVTRQYPNARVVVNGGNCVWADINWVHYLHSAWRADLSEAPYWFRVKSKLVVGWYRRMERKAVGIAKLVIANSQRTNADAIRSIGLSPERVRTLYYGADPTWTPPTEAEIIEGRKLFGLKSSAPVVTFVGGFGYDNRKGFDTLLDAWKLLCEDPGWDAVLVLAGGGKAASRVTLRLQREGLIDRVLMIGFTDKVFELLAATDLLVSPVRYEPYGLNVQEALCRGVPALVSASAGVAEEYSPELTEMLLPDPNDSVDLAARLRRWRGSISTWRDKFRPLSDRLRSRTWDDMSKEIIEAAEEFSPSSRVLS